MFGLRGELRDVGDTVHRVRHPTQQREPVRADRRIVRHDEHIVEEAVEAGLALASAEGSA